MDQWSDGVFLVGRYGELNAGCWLLVHDGQAAVVEMPPFDPSGSSPVDDVARAISSLDLRARFLLCTHCHSDHVFRRTLWNFLENFNDAEAHFVLRDFRDYLGIDPRVHYFVDGLTLRLGTEPIYLVHAPKHSWSDTMIIFRGMVISGDWELNTIRSVHDGKPHAVPLPVKVAAIDRMKRFQRNYDYRIHRVFSVHGNDRRDDVDFETLMEDTLQDRKLW